jgi:ABC-type glycerol-3-phosphate transport system permease component
MKGKAIILTSICLAIFFVILITSFASKNKLSINGVWSFVEVRTVKSDGTSTSTFPKEGAAIFSGNNYSFCWTRHDFKVRNWQVADSVKLNRFNQSIINTGTFTLKDSILTTKAAFAMNPMFSNGGVAKFKFSFSGDTLVLKGLSVVSSDNISHPTYASGSYFVNKLVKIRDE